MKYEDLQQQYGEYKSGLESMTDAKKRMELESGVGGKQQRLDEYQRTILDTGKLLEGVGGRVSSRSRRLGGPVTQGVIDRLTEVQRSPILKQLKELSRGEELSRVGLASTKQDIMQKLGIMSQERSSERQDWWNKIANALTTEREERRLAAQERLAALARQRPERPEGPDPFDLWAKILRQKRYARDMGVRHKVYGKGRQIQDWLRRMF